MSETLTDTPEHETTAPGADETTSDAAHGRHRGSTAADDTADADPHGRHRR
ncbi:hypothetical protein CFP65_2106 [Kitasatospora sp. MMS16-BH015]|uniref:hypothetical protein n=1 Tax=Kitasatospora sp. MMS16-BH015 TaxID=2018025 RepID=UPI000CA1AEEA|nr:hypothetical protein [Kitasatospora sp. MMS16-BH015]AUG76962.1 hypothetical protein CFP65_2106 [Kitasatospora sp. MMS16-BH015]